MTNMRIVTIFVIGLLAFLPVMASGQELAPPMPPDSAPQGYVQQGYAPQPGNPNVMPPPAASFAGAPVAPPQQAYTQEQLDQLVAPIALYPDPLIAQIMMASTYPLEIVEAQRWRQNPQNAALTDPQLQAALEQQPWDPSVKSLVAFPQVLSMMDNNLQWTEQLGDAFLASQPALMNSVQNLRQKAQAAGNLASTPQQTVTQQQGDVIIQPTNPQVVYVPYYNPMVVYGPWPWVGYPPYYFPPPPGYVYYNVGLFGFGIGLAVADWFWGWGYWDWHHHAMIIDDHRFAALNHGIAPHFAGGAWAHDPAHRHGVPYHNAAARQQFQGAATQARQNYRGYFAGTQNRTAGNINPAAASNAQRVGAAAMQQRSVQSSSRETARSQTPAASPRVGGSMPQQRQVQQRSAPMFKSFSRGSDVRAQAVRGSTSRASMPSVSRSAPQAHTGGGSGHGQDSRTR